MIIVITVPEINALKAKDLDVKKDILGPSLPLSPINPWVIVHILMPVIILIVNIYTISNSNKNSI
jgi:hypothetical protein